MTNVEFTSDVVRSATFREKLKGYNPDDVHAFMERSAAAIDQLTTRLAEASARALKAESALAGNSEADESVRRTLVLAQRTAEMAVREANEEAAAIRFEARRETERVLGEAQAEAARLETDARARATELVSDAQRLRAEADSHADSAVSGADRYAATTTAEADRYAAATVAEADARATSTIAQAEAHAEAVVGRAEARAADIDAAVQEELATRHAAAMVEIEERVAEARRETEESIAALGNQRDGLWDDVERLGAYLAAERARVLEVLQESLQRFGESLEPAPPPDVARPDPTSRIIDFEPPTPAPWDRGAAPEQAWPGSDRDHHVPAATRDDDGYHDGYAETEPFAGRDDVAAAGHYEDHDPSAYAERADRYPEPAQFAGYDVSAGTDEPYPVDDAWAQHRRADADEDVHHEGGWPDEADPAAAWSGADDPAGWGRPAAQPDAGWAGAAVDDRAGWSDGAAAEPDHGWAEHPEPEPAWARHVEPEPDPAWGQLVESDYEPATAGAPEPAWEWPGRSDVTPDLGPAAAWFGPEPAAAPDRTAWSRDAWDRVGALQDSADERDWGASEHPDAGRAPWAGAAPTTRSGWAEPAPAVAHDPWAGIDPVDGGWAATDSAGADHRQADDPPPARLMFTLGDEARTPAAPVRPEDEPAAKQRKPLLGRRKG